MLAVAAGDDDASSLAQVGAGDLEAESGGAARDERGPILQLPHRRLPISLPGLAGSRFRSGWTVGRYLPGELARRDARGAPRALPALGIPARCHPAGDRLDRPGRRRRGRGPAGATRGHARLEPERGDRAGHGHGVDRWRGGQPRRLGDRLADPTSQPGIVDQARRCGRGLGDLGDRLGARHLVHRAEPGERAVPRARAWHPGVSDRPDPGLDAAAATVDRGRTAAGAGTAGLPRRVRRAATPARATRRATGRRRRTGSHPGRGRQHRGGAGTRLLPGLLEPGQRVRGGRRVRHHQRPCRGRHQRTVGPQQRRRHRGGGRGVRPRPGHRRAPRSGAERRSTPPGARGGRPRGRWCHPRVPRWRTARRRVGGGAPGDRAGRAQHLRRGRGAPARVRGPIGDPAGQQRRPLRVAGRPGRRHGLRELGGGRRRGLCDRLDRGAAEREGSEGRASNRSAPARAPTDGR